MNRLLDRARRIRGKTEAVAQFAPDDVALASIELFPVWESSVVYAADYKVQHEGQLYRCAQSHTALDSWVPAATPALWTAINETHAGTPDDPIPAVAGMDYEAGKHYLDLHDGLTYICTRGGVLQYLPHELVGIYFEIAQ